MSYLQASLRVSLSACCLGSLVVEEAMVVEILDKINLGVMAVTRMWPGCTRGSYGGGQDMETKVVRRRT